ncbi:MAG: hypothetical protein R8P61_32325 [Bacteroidia bacterium]|nr:hypothetical protein [Bacteroidia bacterium]
MKNINLHIARLLSERMGRVKENSTSIEEVTENNNLLRVAVEEIYYQYSKSEKDFQLLESDLIELEKKLYENYLSFNSDLDSIGEILISNSNTSEVETNYSGIKSYSSSAKQPQNEEYNESIQIRKSKKLASKLIYEHAYRSENFRKQLGPPTFPRDHICFDYLESLKNRPGTLSFFYVHDLRTGEIVSPHNIEKALGFRPRHYKEWLELIHPSVQARYIMLGWQTYERVFNDPEVQVGFLSHKYQLGIPVYESTHNSYFWYLQQSEPLQLDESGNMIRQINFFTKIKRFMGSGLHDKLHPFIFDKDNNQMHDWEANISKSATSDYYSMVLSDIFNTYDWDILDYLNDNLKNREIARLLNLSENTVQKRKAALLKRARQGLPIEIKDTDELLIYLRNNGIY